MISHSTEPAQFPRDDSPIAASLLILVYRIITETTGESKDLWGDIWEAAVAIDATCERHGLVIADSLGKCD